MALFKQTLSCLEACHQCGIVHRDIKPGNLMFGRGTESQFLYVIDFGLSCTAGKATGEGQLQSMVGNLVHSSASVMQRNRPGFGDDIVGLVYSFLDVFFCDLPWTVGGLDTDEIVALKKLDADSWCPARCPSSMLRVLAYAESLPRVAKPDYVYVAKLLRTS
jgi:casein kinase I family protein HRR25